MPAPEAAAAGPGPSASDVNSPTAIATVGATASGTDVRSMGAGVRLTGVPVRRQVLAAVDVAPAAAETGAGDGGTLGGLPGAGASSVAVPSAVATGVQPSAVVTSLPSAVATSTTSACNTLTTAQVLALLGTGPVFVAPHPSGKIFFTSFNGNQVGFYDPGTMDFVTSPSDATGLPANSGPAGIALGPDGMFWVAEFGANGATAYRIDEFNFDATDTFELIQHPLPVGDTLTGPFDAALGPDGNMWITLSTAAGIQSVTAEAVFSAAVPALAQPADANPMPTGIVEGTDNALWFAETGVDKIARIDPVTDAITEYPVTACSAPSSLALGSDSNLWFTEPGTQKIAKMAMTGAQAGAVLQEYSLQSGAVPIGITSGPDCNIWFTEAVTDVVGSIDVGTGAVSESTALTAGADPAGLTLGADGNLYVAESGLDAIAQIVVTPAQGGSNQCAAPLFPAIASCQDGPVTIGTSPGKCTAIVSPSAIDSGSSDPTFSPAAAPSEAVAPAAAIPAGTSTEVALLVGPAARPSGAPGVSPAVPRPVSACHVAVTAKDEEKPKITCPPAQTVECGSPSGTAVMLGAPTATDNCGLQGAPSCAPAGASFGLGTTQVTCTATDTSNNVNSCQTSVTVQDTKPPVISSVAANPSALPPDGKTDPVAVVPTVADACDPMPPACTITGVTGGTASIGGPLTVSLVAQPVGLFPRTFTIAIKCVDEANNGSTSSVQVTVRSPLAQAILDLIAKVDKAF
ncbi:MAG TPA: HYR domain-containing protein [Candidatus Binataceae bacterium]|nr:HYR domain-containing protein [Candidatus Binataceae bacterium]